MSGEDQGELLEGHVMGSGVAEALAAGMSLTSVADRIYKVNGKEFYKSNTGELTELKAARTKPCPMESDNVSIRGVTHFIDYLKPLDLSGAAIFYDVNSYKFVCVLDNFAGPTNDEGFKAKRVTLHLSTSRALAHWLKHNRKQVDQEVLADHMEERLEDIIKPDGGVMLDVVNNFHATTRVDFSKAQKLGNGQVQLSYVEDIEANAGESKNLVIPETFELAIPIFEPIIGDSYENELTRIKARFRYRVNRNTLTMSYLLDNLDGAVLEETEAIFDHIKDATGLNIFVGAL